MKSVAFEGTVEEFAGKKLDTPIKFSGTADQYENITELRNSEDFPSDSEILKIVNRSKVTAAKASEYQKATKPLKEAYESSDAYKRDQLIKAAVAAGFSQAEAEALAASKIG